MSDMFTGGDFIELPPVSIYDDCNAWFEVFEACLQFAHDRGAFDGNETDVSNAINEVQLWLIETDCIDPP